MFEATANFIGKDGFNWWIGQVENIGDGSYDVETKEIDETDFDYNNKVKVRIVGYHNESRVELPTKHLPWAQVLMPPIYAQKSGIGSNHQLQLNSWVVGFFMDGAAAQIPIVMGSITDENPDVNYGTEKGKKEGFAKLAAGDYDERHHINTGSTPPNSGNNVKKDSTTGFDSSAMVMEDNPFSAAATTVTTSNKRALAIKNESAAGFAADAAKRVTVQVGNGKCGSETATKLEGPMAEFMKFARGMEKNEIDEFIDKKTGDIVDLEKEITSVSDRIGTKIRGLTQNIKGVVMEEVDKLVTDGLDKLSIPDPKKDEAVRKQLKDVGDLVSCLFKQILDEIGDFIKGLLKDLIENVLDTALCLIQNILGDIMKKLMDKIKDALGILKGVMGAIKGAADKIQGILNKVLEFIDLFCDGALSCAIGASVFETGVGGRKKGRDDTDDDDDDDKKGPLERFEGINFYTSDGEIATAALNCDSGILNRKPCFPELVWDNLQSTTPIKAIAIVDDIGQMLGVLMRKKGKSVNREAQVKAQFTCNEPEGSGAKFRPNIVNGVVDSIEVIKPGIGYGFDPATTFCPNEQYGVKVKKTGLTAHVKDGEYIEQVTTSSPDVLQVVDVDYDDDHILLATIDTSFNPKLVAGLQLRTKSGHEFTLNFTQKFPTLVIPPNATAIYAKCGDLIPRVNEVKVVNVGKGYKNPIITVGTGKDKQQIGTYTVDSQGRLIRPTITKTVLGFVKPVIEDSEGTGAKLSVVYEYSGPREIKESNILQLQTYIDCVGHPMITTQETITDTATTTTTTTTTVNTNTNTTQQTTQQNNNTQQNQGGYGY